MTKVCSNCRQAKPESEFRQDAGQSDFLFAWCKDCDNANRLKNLHSAAATGICVYCRVHPQDGETTACAECRERRRLAEVSRRANKTTSEPTVRWSTVDKERRRSQHRLMDQIKWHRRRAADAGVLSTLTAQQWLDILDSTEWTCARCGLSNELSIDHIVPVSIGGTNTADNVQPLCRSCNSIKGLSTTNYLKVAG